jgi:cation transporter-like permease
MGAVGFLHGGRTKRTRKEHVMRRFLQLATVLLAAVAAAPQVGATQVAAVPGIGSTPSLICVLPKCNGAYCRASNGCWVCCT